VADRISTIALEVERALRRALPLSRETHRGAAPTADHRLPRHDTFYSLRSLLGGRSGPGGLWLTPMETYQELERQYRKLAEQATRAGDYRRAAFIYGKLLEDFRSAALHHAGHDVPAVELFNAIARLADKPGLSPIRADLRDRALLGIAARLRRRVQQGQGLTQLVSSFMGTSGVWPAPLVSDAQFAMGLGPKHARRTAEARGGPSRIRLQGRLSTIRSVTYAPGSGLIFVGMESGEVIVFEPCSGEVSTLADERAPVLGLATTHDGSSLVVLSQRRPGEMWLSSYSRSVGYRMVTSTSVQVGQGAWLCPSIASGKSALYQVPQMLVLWDGTCLQFCHGSALLPLDRWDLSEQGITPEAALLGLPSPEPSPFPGVRGVTAIEPSTGRAAGNRSAGAPACRRRAPCTTRRFTGCTQARARWSWAESVATAPCAGRSSPSKAAIFRK
jgi:hypothetical protein